MGKIEKVCAWVCLILLSYIGLVWGIHTLPATSPQAEAEEKERSERMLKQAERMIESDRPKESHKPPSEEKKDAFQNLAGAVKKLDDAVLAAPSEEDLAEHPAEVAMAAGGTALVVGLGIAALMVRIWMTGIFIGLLMTLMTVAVKTRRRLGYWRWLPFMIVGYIFHQIVGLVITVIGLAAAIGTILALEQRANRLVVARKRG